MFQDEVDVHLNPKIGCQWMVRGEQAEVVTPGDNEKRHLAGSLVWRTGTLLVSQPERRRNAAMFIAHLDDLRQRLRTYRVIHVMRQRQVPRLPRHSRVLGSVEPPNSAALPAQASP